MTYIQESITKCRQIENLIASINIDIFMIVYTKIKQLFKHLDLIQELQQTLKMNEFMTPPLLITEYYDSLISQIDIYTEETIKEYKEKGLPKKE